MEDSGARFHNAEEFWKQNLPQFESCFLSHLNAATSSSSSVDVSGRETIDCHISESTLRFFQQASETSALTTLQTAWATVLGKYLATESVTFMSANLSSNGLLQNNICHVEWDEKTTTGEVTKNLVHWHKQSLPYQGKVLSSLANHTPVCDTAVRMSLETSTTLKSFGQEPLDNCFIVVNLSIHEGNVKLGLECSTSSIASAQVKSLSGSLKRGLESAVSNPSHPISLLDLCPEDDVQQLLNMNATVPDTIYDCVHTLFEQQVATRPHSLAIVGYGGDMTFKQLNDRANRLSLVLQDLGVGPEVYVPFCFAKSTLTIVAMLAILKAGGACVALNPSHPIARLEGIARKTEAKVVLTDESHTATFSGIVNNTICLTQESLDDGAINGPNTGFTASTNSAVSPQNPAFVVFTSGSTGEPKGIILEHRALCTSMKNHGAAMRLDSKSRSLQFAAYTFDVSIGEIFTTLLHGGCVCVPSDEERLTDLAGVIGRLRVNWAYLTPTVASLLDPRDVPTLKTLSLGGEAIKQENIETWADHVYLINIYGPAETTIWSTGLTDLNTKTPATNLGFGLGALMWVTDPQDYNRLCPIGAIGEILIEGPILARGYLKDKPKTEAAFIEDPAWLPEGHQPRRLYRSADLGFVSPDGTLRFVGRRDNQVKMYGQRIEMGEIEFHLKQLCPEIQSCAVEMVRPKVQNEQPCLAAFVCSKVSVQKYKGGNDLTLPVTTEIRDYLLALKDALAQHLPSYMIPSLFVPLVYLPTSVSGKLDRQNLRELASNLTVPQISTYALSSTNKEAPVTSNEKFLHVLWAQVLGLPENSIGRLDSFFQLGGDSISAMKLIKVARQAERVLKMSSIFRHPTLVEMAKVLDVNSYLTAIGDIKPFSLLNTASSASIVQGISGTWNIPDSEIQDVYPCTPLQEGLMAITQRRPGTYIYQNIFDIPASVDISRFRAAWETAVDTIEILRMTIVPGDSSGAYQVIKEGGIEWQSSTDISEYLRSDATRSMQYGDSLARYAIVERGDLGATFIWTAHHALYDGWSLPLILQRVEQIYKSDKPSQDVKPVPFQQFISHLQNSEPISSENFWKEQLLGVSPPKFPHLPAVSYEPRVNEIYNHQLSLPQHSTTGVTNSSLIRGAWSILMSQYSDAGDDIVFGVTTAGRSADIPGIIDMIAPTIATVPVRVHIDREQTVRQFLNTIQSQTVDMIPFEHMGLQNIAKINRDCRTACGFQNLLVVQPEEDDNLKSTLGIRQRTDPAVGIHTYALVVQAMLRSDSIKLQVDFDNNVLSSWQVQRICYQLDHIIHQLVSNISTQLGQLTYCSDEDMKQLMEWNRDIPYVETRCVHEIIESQARLTPEAEAICSWDGNFTYKEVDRLSNRLARYLVELGVGPEIMVPYCFNKSAWTVIVMLAIVKAGGACVALDPGHPTDRMETIITNASARLVITTPEHCHRFENSIPKVISFTPETFATITKDDSSVPLRSTVRNPIFVLYTSGSTGKPKGIVIEHGMFASSAAAHSAAFGITSKSRVFQFAAYTFDVSVGDIFTSLMRGACICVPSDTERMNNISGAINRMKANYSFLTPTVANLLNPSEVPTLKGLTLGGEASTYENIRTWAEYLNLIVCYGPAECSVYCSVNPPATLQSNPASLGKAVGALIWLVDPQNHNRLAPVGCVGELVVQGPTVARGYLNEPEKTASSFIDNPTWLPKGLSGNYHRIYKTGDLARYNPDGSLIFVARKDTQVKVRGQRVELAEIEVYLSHSPEIKHAMLSVPTEGSYKGRLVCVLSFQELSPVVGDFSESEIQLVDHSDKEKAANLISTVQERLTEKLPPYMIPAVWVIMKNIVLNTSGKMDRKRVKGWLEDVDESSYRFIADIANAKVAADRPTTDIEKKIQLAFSKSLNLSISNIGLETSFLVLGGDSISAMQVMSRLRSENVIVSVQDILRHKTTSAIAKRAQINEGDIRRDMRIEAEILDEYFELAPIQKLFFEMQPLGQNHFNQSFVLNLAQDISIITLKNTLRSILQRHSMLRSRYANIDGVWRQKITTDIDGSLLLAPSQGFSSRELMLEEFSRIQKLLDIRKGPILAAEKCCLADENYLFITIHHLVVDLVSWRIIIQDLEDIITSGKFTSQPPISFQMWANMQHEYAPRLLTDSATAINAYPADFAYWDMAVAKSNTWGDITESSFTIDEKTTRLLLSDCHRALRTQPIDVMISALIFSFQNIFTDRRAPSVFLEGHGREPWSSDIDISRTVGWFTTMYPVSVDTNATTSKWLDVVKRVKDNRQSIPNNGWSYFTSRLLNTSSSQTTDDAKIEILFNYSGLYQQLHRSDALLRETDISSAQCGEISPEMERYSLFEITASVVDQGKMKFSFEYNRNMTRQVEIHSWIKSYNHTLESGINQLLGESETATLMDFPMLSLSSYSELDKLTATILPAAGIRSLDQVETICPCSPMQLSILFAQLNSPGDYEFYTILEASCSSRTEKFDVQVLLESWQQVVDRHSALRTIFIQSAVDGGSYDQLILNRMQAPVSEVHSDDPVEHLRNTTPVTIFDGKVPHQLTICHTSTGRVFCKLEVNHALIDGTSMAIILRDIKRAYSGRLEASMSALPYSDFVAYLQQARKHESIDYWKGHLQGVQPCRFPILDDGRTRASALQSVDVQLSSLTRERLVAFSDQYGLTVANVIQMAWALVLRIFTGTDSVCYGYLTSGRDAPLCDIENAVGPYIHMLVCCQRFDANDSTLKALKNVQEDFLQAMPHQYVSLSEIQSALGLSGQKLFNTAMSFQRYPKTEKDTLSLDAVYDFDPTEFDITVNVATSDDDGLKVDLTYWTSKVSPDNAKNIAHTFSTIISSLFANPENLISEIDSLSERDQRQLGEWNTYIPAAIDRCMHDMISQRARERPDSHALESWEATFTYDQLDKASTRLAGLFASFGIQPDDCIPLCFEKSIYTIVSMVAVLKAGGAFVLLDPKFPDSRLNGILSDINARFMIASPQTENRCKQLLEQIIVVSPAIIDSLPDQITSNITTPNPDNIMYVQFTSGSTGKPKGAVVHHRAACSSIEYHGKVMRYGPNSRAYQFSSYTFDAIILEAFTTLYHGGCVCVPSEEARMNRMVESMRELNVNIMFMTPTLARLFKPEDVPSLETLMLGGEPISQDCIQIWGDKVHLIGGYGPAECCVYCCYNPLSETKLRPEVIGYQVGSALWIVDAEDHNKLLSVGSVGELIIQGPIVGRCYLNDETRTEASYIASPSWLREYHPGEHRLYKTGDLARHNSDGTLTIIGRKDSQVKVRGQRVELGEIEHTLKAFPEVVQASVVFPKIGPSKDRLVAVVTLHDIMDKAYKLHDLRLLTGNVNERAKRSLTSLRRSLEENLPFYMVPSILTVVERLPLQASGKTDTRSVKNWVEKLDEETYRQILDIEDSEGPVEPRNEVEAQIQLTFASILGLQQRQVMLDRSFISLGGDSISAMKAMTTLQKAGIPLTITNILRGGSISRIAEAFAKDQSHDLSNISGGSEWFGLSPIQSALMRQFSGPSPNRIKSDAIHTFTDNMIVSLKIRVEEAEMRTVFNNLAQRHSILCTRFNVDPQGHFTQTISPNIRNGFIFDVTHEVDEFDVNSIMSTTTKKIDIFSGLVFGVHLVFRKKHAPLLFLVAHRLIVDSTSWTIILKDLERFLRVGSPAEISKPAQQLSDTQQNIPAQDLEPLPGTETLKMSCWNNAGDSLTGKHNKQEPFIVDPTATKALLGRANLAFGTDAVDLFLSALLTSFGTIFPDHNPPSVLIENHRRSLSNDGEYQSLVGPFTIPYTLVSLKTRKMEVFDVIKRVKDSSRQHIRSCGSQLSQNSSSSVPDVVLRYLPDGCKSVYGRSLFTKEWPFTECSKLDGLHGNIEIDVQSNSETLEIIFYYDDAKIQEKRISRWASAFQGQLRELAHQLLFISNTKTLSDYPLLPMTYDELDTLLQTRLPEIGISDLGNIEDIYPCSPLQEGLLLAQTKGTGTYNTYIYREVTPCQPSFGNVSIENLVNAWKTVVNRHQVLRTIFIQGVNKTATFAQVVLRNVDAKPLVFNDSNPIQRLRKEPPTVFQNVEPWHNLLVCQDNSGKTFCRIDIHHALFDATSVETLFRELSESYGDKITQSAPLYRNYISYLRAQQPAVALSYWKDFLQGVEPCDFPTINEQSNNQRETLSMEFEVPRYDSIQSLSSRTNVTVATILQIAWAMVLSHYTGSEDVCFGFLSNGRDIAVPDVNNLIGPLINMLVCRIKLGPDTNLKDIFDSAQDNFLNSLSHQHSSLAEIYHSLSLSGKALFNTSLSFVNETFGEDSKGQTAIEFTNVGGHGSTEVSALSPSYSLMPFSSNNNGLTFLQYDIAVNVSASKSAIQVVFTYRSSVLSVHQAKYVAEAFIKSINNLTNLPDQTAMKQIDFTSDLMYNDLQMGHSKQLHPVYDCVHDLFRRAASRYPDHMAICSVEGNYTYKELDNITTCFSYMLKELGVGPEILVPVCFQKSPWTIISMLSVLKAGGACVPLDPSHPDNRIRGVVTNCKANIILSAPKYASRLAAMVEKVISVNYSFVESLQSMDYHHERINVGPENAAFVVFTSGSTGTPKGIVLEHKGLCTMFLANAPVVGIGPSTRTFQYAAYTFDVSIAETYITLIHGGCVCVPTEEERMNDIEGSISRMEANWTFLTPSVASLLHPDDVPTLKTLTLGGEAIARDLHSCWAGRVCLINSYGPAECSIWTSNNQLFADSSPGNIGGGVNCHLWVTEPHDHNKLVPIGCVGELVVQGPNLARGYLNDREKTNSAYIDSPLWLRGNNNVHEEENRVYKTGDLVRQRGDGSMEFVGRKDTQVKFHGQRIEIGEVEYQLRARLPSNSEVAMEMIKPLSQNSRQTLAAFICLGKEENESTSTTAIVNESTPNGESDFLQKPTETFKEIINTLEASLSDSLPVYMIPSLFVNVKWIPKNTSMKIDRKALRLRGEALSMEEISSYSFVSGEKLAPRTPAETKLHQLWTEVLKISGSAIGIDDNFFRVGGDSVAAMQLVAAARKAGLSLSVMDIFQNTTLRDMALAAKFQQKQYFSVEIDIEPFSLLHESDVDTIVESNAKILQIDSEQVQDIYPCTPLQEGLMSLTMRDRGLYTLQAVFSIPSQVQLDRFRSAWDELVEDLDILRTRLVDYEDQGMHQVVMRPTVDNIQWNYANNLQTYLQEDRKVLFEYGKPLARYSIVAEESCTYFVWTAHHSIYDGWSLTMMLDLLSKKYNQEQSPRTPPFKNFMKWMMGLDEATTREFWISTFSTSTAPSFPSIPRGYRPKATEIVTQSIKIPQRSNTGITLPTILRTAWALNISRYTGSEDVVFGMTQSGRNAPVPGVTDIVAPLITTVPVRVTFDKQQPIESLLKEVQKTSIEMIPHEHAGLQNIGKFSLQCQTACKFQNLLVIQPHQETARNPLDMEQIPVTDLDIPAFAIVVECDILDGEIMVRAGYDPDIVSPAQMSNILAQFDHIITVLCQETESTGNTLRSLPLLAENDQRQLQEWNQSHNERVNRCAHDMIHERVLTQPDALAIDAPDAKLNYKQLDDLSTQLSYLLVDTGVGADDVVPLFFDKSAWAIVSMLGVMKSGAAFVFLDPSHPLERIQYITESIKARFVITSPKLKKVWKLNIPAIIISPSFFSSRPHHSSSPMTNVTPRSTLYVIFTSGSTGRPKGCVIEHSSFLTGAFHHGQCTDLSPRSRVLQIAPYTFDVSILETLTGLLFGSCICLPGERHKGVSVAETINDLHITWSFLTPSVARTISQESVPSLKTLILGGESLSRIDIETWAGKLLLVNGYGPSECSIAVAANREITQKTDASNIGSKMGCNCWVVSSEDHNSLLPIGAVGELLVEGSILSRGYLNEPEKTAAVFIENPTWSLSQPGYGGNRRFYKTGDLVYFNSDGTIRFVGRKDTQVKLRGLRIEIGEIEHHTSAYPAVKHATVALPRSGKFKDSLVTIYSLKQRSLNNKNENENSDDLQPLEGPSLDDIHKNLPGLRSSLSQRLPPYMVPTHFIGVQDLPLLPSGKIDRTKITRWLETMDNKTHEVVATQSGSLANHAARLIEESNSIARAISQKVTHLLARSDEEYAETIRNRNIGLLQAGMNSISVVSLASFIKQEFGVRIPIEALMKSSTTIEDVASIVGKADLHKDTKKVNVLTEVESAMEELEREVKAGSQTEELDLTPLNGHPYRVFLTGATGFLGSVILRHLLESPLVRSVVVLVRANDKKHAMERIVSSATLAKWWRQDVHMGRLDVWVGDLSKPQLGLGDVEWQQIKGQGDSSQRIDAIIHNGAAVHWVADYESLKQTNVSSVVSLLRSLVQSSSAHPPRFTFVSGGEISLEDQANIDESEIVESMAMATGYAQTKFVADEIVRRFSKKYPTAFSSIVKPGLIIGTAESGVSNADDFFWRVVATAVDIQGYNAEEQEATILLAGAQQVASAVIETALTNDIPPVETLVSHGVTTRDLWGMLSEEFGYPMQPMDPDTWLEKMKEKVHATGEQHRLWPVLHFLEATGGHLGRQLPRHLEQNKDEREEVRASLRSSINYMRRIGYLASDANSVSKPALQNESGFTRSVNMAVNGTSFS
ncbi:Nonribosomal peptide synthetase 8 [Talaromyces islandicus]|uniref:Nonribosomal peptide synthetase 8 n=1 Tax=Talaromyces islandicus TaxID=28573 RepID=A0A0U1LYF4_TALIS|nr:Nonribosomal peptide synthetase 8 [Talaromyces islandicus]